MEFYDRKRIELNGLWLTYCNINDKLYKSDFQKWKYNKQLIDDCWDFLVNYLNDCEIKEMKNGR